MVFMGLIISLSAIMYGYGLKSITSIPIARIALEYGIGFDLFMAQGILIGIMPFGAMFGSLFTKLLIKNYRRVTGIYVFGVLTIISIVII
jgi:hypothetical protein